ncbi:hypothetical protein P7C73_g4603, partial [Tremellales sp. Uapishka_1]
MSRSPSPSVSLTSSPNRPGPYDQPTHSLHPSNSSTHLVPSNSYTRRSSTPLSSPVTPRHPGCVLCGIVASAASSSSSTLRPEHASPLPSPSPTSASFLVPGLSRVGSTSQSTLAGGREIVYSDSDITVYKALAKERLCSNGKHLIVVLNRHLESVYDFGPADITLLSHVLDTSHDLLSPLGSTLSDGIREESGKPKVEDQVRVGFVGSVMKDPQSPYAHLHAHAMIGPIDTSLPGATFFRRNVVFGSMNWWSVEDLRAEIRESTSNNRVKSGYSDRRRAPIDQVPDAGALSGQPNFLDVQNESSLRAPIPQSASMRAEASASSSRTATASSSRGKRPMEYTASSSEHGDLGDGYVGVDLDALR